MQGYNLIYYVYLGKYCGNVDAFCGLLGDM